MAKFKCPCKYTYDPEKSAPKQDIPSDTPLKEYPTDDAAHAASTKRRNT